MRAFLALAAIVIATGAGGSAVGAEKRNVAIVVYPGVELLDFAGPGEVFSGADWNEFTVAATHDSVVSQGFVKITPEHSIADSPKIDILVIPGGHAASIYDDPKMMAWVKARTGAAELTMSVCNGALVLARAGLLDGLRATSHYSAIPALKKFPRITVDAKARFVDNRRIVTTQGVSAGIDGALHVVERLLGSEQAWGIARYMMYRWEPTLSQQQKDDLRPYVEQDWPKVAAIYQRKLDANPKDGDAAFRLGVAQTELKDHAHAVVTLERAVALGVSNPDALDELGDSHVALGHYKEAARTYEREIPLRPSQTQPFIAMSAAKAWARAGDKEAAIAILQRWAPKLEHHAALRNEPAFASLRGDTRFETLAR